MNVVKHTFRRDIPKPQQTSPTVWGNQCCFAGFGGEGQQKKSAAGFRRSAVSLGMPQSYCKEASAGSERCCKLLLQARNKAGRVRSLPVYKTKSQRLHPQRLNRSPSPGGSTKRSPKRRTALQKGPSPGRETGHPGGRDSRGLKMGASWLGDCCVQLSCLTCHHEPRPKSMSAHPAL